MVGWEKKEKKETIEKKEGRKEKGKNWPKTIDDLCRHLREQGLPGTNLFQSSLVKTAKALITIGISSSNFPATGIQDPE